MDEHDLQETLRILNRRIIAEHGFGYTVWLLMVELLKDLMARGSLTPKQVRIIVSRAANNAKPLLQIPNRMEDMWLNTFLALELPRESSENQQDDSGGDVN